MTDITDVTMSTIVDFQEAATKVSNWGRWGADDELGTLNLITEAKVSQAAALVQKGRVFPLGVEFSATGPQGAFHMRGNPVHLMVVDGGDANHFVEHSKEWSQNATAQQISSFFEGNPFRFNEDVIFMPLQAATQWDALSHCYYDDFLYNGFPAAAVTSQGASRVGIDKVVSKGITSRGVLLDVVKHRGFTDVLEPGESITPDELDAIAAAQGVTIEAGDIVLLHTGWWTNFTRTKDGVAPLPGLNWRCAEWLHKHDVAAIASDSYVVEHPVSEMDGVFLPFHLLCLRDMGLMLGEFWDTAALAADCAEDGRYEFQIVAPPLCVIGGVGSPVNPIAIK